MTEKQAYKILTNTPIRAKENHTEYSKALHVALDALSKQIPQKPIEDGYYDEPCVCPNCGQPLNYIELVKRCRTCGQAISWEGDTNV